MTELTTGQETIGNLAEWQEENGSSDTVLIESIYLTNSKSPQVVDARARSGQFWLNPTERAVDSLQVSLIFKDKAFQVMETLPGKAMAQFYGLFITKEDALAHIAKQTDRRLHIEEGMAQIVYFAVYTDKGIEPKYWVARANGKVALRSFEELDKKIKVCVAMRHDPRTMILKLTSKTIPTSYDDTTTMVFDYLLDNRTKEKIYLDDRPTFEWIQQITPDLKDHFFTQVIRSVD